MKDSSVSSLKVGVSGVRGIVGESLTPELVVDFARAFGTFLDGGKVLLASDTRVSGPWMRALASGGLMSTGCQIVDIGVMPTPTCLVATRELKARGCLILTASHNPMEWNGMKFVREDGLLLNAYQANQLVALFHARQFKTVGAQELRKPQSRSDAFDIHADKIFSAVAVRKIRERRFKVAIDPCNGTGACVTKGFLESMGCDVKGIHTDPSGIFAHDPEPTSANLRDLSRLVKNEHTDIGFAQDPDADRLALVDERGEPVSEELTLALAVKFVLGRRKGKVVVNLSTTRAIDDIARAAGTEVVRTPIGESHVAERMREGDCAIGGEGNGGVMFPHIHCGRDSFVGMAILLEYLVESGYTLSQLISQLPHYEMVKRKIHWAQGDHMPRLAERIRTRFAKQPIDLSDGIKVEWKHGWAHVRSSNTEPVLRVVAEAKTKAEAEDLCDQMMEEVKQVMR